jgi:auxin efflux carrier family protein
MHIILKNKNCLLFTVWELNNTSKNFEILQIKVHVVIRKSATNSTTGRSINSYNNKLHGINSAMSMTPRASNLTGVEIYSLQSSREPTPRGSSFNQTDFYAMFSSKLASPNPMAVSGQDDEKMKNKVNSKSSELYTTTTTSSYPTPNPVLSGLSMGSTKKELGGSNSNSNKELHMFVWSSSASPVSEANMRNAVNRAASTDFGAIGNNPSPKGMTDNLSGNFCQCNLKNYKFSICVTPLS